MMLIEEGGKKVGRERETHMQEIELEKDTNRDR